MMDTRCDLHLHSCLSPCGDKDMTPYNLVHLAKLLELDCIALTDHNTSLNCPAALRVGQEAGICVVPGMELCTREEVHVVCLFPALDNALAFSDYVAQNRPDIANRPKIFGEQLLMDHRDTILSRYDPLLTTASNIPTAQAPFLVADFGGVCFPAHIDRPSYSIVSNLGSIRSDMGFTIAEFATSDMIPQYKQNSPDLQNMMLLQNSDAHYLEQMRPGGNVLPLPEITSAALVKYLQNWK